MKDEGNTERFLRHASRHKAWYTSGTVVTVGLAVAGFIFTHYVIPAWDARNARLDQAEQWSAMIPDITNRLDRLRERIHTLQTNDATLNLRIYELERKIKR